MIQTTKPKNPPIQNPTNMGKIAGKRKNDKITQNNIGQDNIVINFIF